jgi:DNA-binding transcriptional ArsR family regulator
MVNYHERLSRTFAALGDPTRRAILARLEREDGATVSELARPFAIKLPAVMKHLDVLDDAGLITPRGGLERGARQAGASFSHVIERRSP